MVGIVARLRGITDACRVVHRHVVDRMSEYLILDVRVDAADNKLGAVSE